MYTRLEMCKLDVGVRAVDAGTVVYGEDEMMKS